MHVMQIEFHEGGDWQFRHAPMAELCSVFFPSKMRTIPFRIRVLSEPAQEAARGESTLNRSERLGFCQTGGARRI